MVVGREGFEPTHGGFGHRLESCTSIKKLFIYDKTASLNH